MKLSLAPWGNSSRNDVLQEHSRQLDFTTRRSHRNLVQKMRKGEPACSQEDNLKPDLESWSARCCHATTFHFEGIIITRVTYLEKTNSVEQNSLGKADSRSYDTDSIVFTTAHRWRDHKSTFYLYAQLLIIPSGLLHSGLPIKILYVFLISRPLSRQT